MEENKNQEKRKTFDPEERIDIDFNDEDKALEITPYERLKKELLIIEAVFNCQFQKASSEVSTPTLHNDGRYLCWFALRSNFELLNAQKYFKHYTERYENAINTSLIKNELLFIQQEAQKLVDFFNRKLTRENSELLELFDYIGSDQFFVDTYFKEKHVGVIVVDYLSTTNIIFEKSAHFIEDDMKWTTRNFNYSGSNRTFVDFCNRILIFIDKFDFGPNPKIQKTEYWNENYNELFAVSEQKRLFRVSEGKIKTINSDEPNKYDLLNCNIYDEQTGELYQVGEQYKYNKNFFSKLVNIDPLKVDEFLNYHNSKTSDNSKFEKHLNLVVLTHNHFENRNKSIKKAIQIWIEHNTNFKEDSNETPEPPKVVSQTPKYI